MSASEERFQNAQLQRNHNSILTRNKFIEMSARDKYNKHKEERKDSWRTCEKSFLVSRAVQELGEFLEKPSFEEAGDVLNFMSMILRREEIGE